MAHTRPDPVASLLPQEPIRVLVSTPIGTHGVAQCAGRPCCLHNPSPHPLSTAPLVWREPARIMMRLCPHSVLHPDPDDLTVRAAAAPMPHGCDGCCCPRPVVQSPSSR